MVGTWKLLKSVAVGSGGADSIDTGELGSYDFLKVSVYLIPSGGNIHGYMYFNGDGTSTGNYARRGCSNGGSGSSSGDFEVSPDDEINFTNQVNETCSAFFAIANPNSSTGKQITGWEQEDGGSDNTTSPDRFEWAFKYKTTGRITSIQVKNNLSGSSNFAEHSYITVWGSSDDTVTDEKDSLTNVPANTRYEETDTRKIYRNKQVGFANGSSGSGSDWTEVAFDSSTAVNNATASGNVVSRSSGSAWDSYIRSTTHYLDPSEGGGEVYFTVSNNTHISCGLEKSPYNEYPSAVYQDRDYSYHTTTATNNMYEKTSSYDGTDWNSNTNEWRITMSSAGEVKYYYRENSSSSWNLERTSTVTASGKYYVSVSPHSTATCTCFIKSPSTKVWIERNTA